MVGLKIVIVNYFYGDTKMNTKDNDIEIYNLYTNYS